MKIPRKTLPVIFLIAAAAGLIVTAALMMLHTPVQSSWGGVRPLDTSTPTISLFAEQDWWTPIPTSTPISIP